MGQHRRHTGPSNRGESTLLSGETSVEITHGLVHKPRIVLANPSSDVDAWRISNINDTNFTFTCDTQPGADTAIYWYVE